MGWQAGYNSFTRLYHPDDFVNTKHSSDPTKNKQTSKPENKKYIIMEAIIRFKEIMYLLSLFRHDLRFSEIDIDDVIIGPIIMTAG